MARGILVDRGSWNTGTVIKAVENFCSPKNRSVSQVPIAIGDPFIGGQLAGANRPAGM